MPRIDYDIIKDKFEQFVRVFNTHDLDSLNNIIHQEARVNLSVIKDRVDGSCHTIEGYKEFIRNYPKTDYLKCRIYNYICTLQGNEAQQFAYVICIASNEVEGTDKLEFFQYSKIFSIHWHKYDNNWMMNSIKMDIYDRSQVGTLDKYFKSKWHFEDYLAILKPGVHTQCCMSDFDSPWLAIENPEDVYTEEEKVKYGLYHYNYGIDQLCFFHCLDGIANSYNVSGTRHHNEGKRNWLTNIKFNRQKARYWVHPYKFLNIDIEGDRAYVRCCRMAGSGQTAHEYVWTKDNVNIEHACADCHIEMVKENGMWRMCYFGYDTGLYEVDEYSNKYYGDMV